MNKTTQHSNRDLTIQLVDEHGIDRTALDFAALGCSPTLNAMLKDVFQLESGHLRYETQLQAWRCIRKFSLFLKQSGLATTAHFPSDLFIRWQEWLSQQALLPSTQQSVMNVSLHHINALARHYPSFVPEGLEQNVPRFKRQPPVQPTALNKAELKAIIKACQTEILATEARMQEGQAALAGTHENDDFVKVLQTLTLVQPHKAVSQKEMLKLPRPTRLLVSALGGLKHLNSCRFLIAKDLLGFYVMILAQTAGNPMAIRQLRRDCVAPHPLRSDLSQILWEKHRAWREQDGNFPTNHRWSAPSLVNRLAILNENLRHDAPPGHADYLFLSQRNGRVSLPIYQLFHQLLDAFIEKHNLPKFDFKQLRPTDASLIPLETGDISAVQSKLNHRHRTTSIRYIRASLLEEHRARTISRFQGELIQLSRDAGLKTVKINSQTKGTTSPAETVFGFLCKDPFSGIAPGSVRGSCCENFNGCATCPGAIVTLDDPTVVAKMLATQKYLTALGERAIAEGWSRRFDALYRPTLTVIEQDLFPAISAAVKQTAQKIADDHPLPYLE